MKNILVPTDFSDCANAASEYAIQFANKAKAEIQFFHIQQTPVDWVKLPLDKEKLYPEIKKQIGRAKSKLSMWVRKATKKKVAASQSLSFYTGNEEILKHLENFHYDFLIMGSHGSKGFRENLIGSNAQQILRKANVPVLIIKNGTPDSIRNILFVSDFKDVSKTAFHTLMQFADSVDAHVNLLFVNTPNEFKETAETNNNMDKVLTDCNREDACTKNSINAMTVEEGINQFVISNPIDLIAICTHGKSGLRQLFAPSIAEQVANHSDLPVLSIRL